MSRTQQEGPIRGRGASWNPANRFAGGRQYVVEEDVGGEEDAKPLPKTVYLDDDSKSVLTRSDSPDLGYEVGLNPYRGCEHGCVYCYARPTHEYFGLSAGLDFESKIFVKRRVATLLRGELEKPKYEVVPISMSGITDVYQPVERELQLTRRCLEVLEEFQHPVGLITKNRLITRDVDILGRMASWGGVAAYVSITTLDLGMNRVLEPRTSSPAQRLEAVRCLAEVGVPVGVMVAPVVPGLTDHELPGILAAAREAGATKAGYIVMRLPYAVAPMFAHWLEAHFPDRKEKVLHRIRELRGGQLNDPRFGTRMTGEGIWAEQLRRVFEVSSRKLGYTQGRSGLNRERFRRPGGSQLRLF